MVINITLLLFIAVAVYLDVKTRTIPKWVTIPMALMGIVYYGATLGKLGVVHSLQGLLLGFLIMLIPYLAGGMGGGDVKLMAAIGAVKGPYFIFFMAVFLTVVAVIVTTIVLVREKRFVSTWKYYLHYFLHILSRLTFGIFDRDKPDNLKHITTYPFAIVIGASVFLAVAFEFALKVGV